MLYKEAIEDELEIMLQKLKESPESLSHDQIHISLCDLMLPPIAIEIGASLQEGIEMINNNNVGSVLVKQDGILKGIFGERDVMRKILSARLAEGWSAMPVEKFMTPDPQTLSFDDTLDVAMLNMVEGDYRHIPIVDEHNRPVGIISMRCIISYFIECLPQTMLAFPIRTREGA